MHFCLDWTVLRTQLVKVLAAQSFELFVTLWTVACQALCLWNSPGKNAGSIVGSIPFSRGSSQPRDWTRISCIAGRFFTIWVTREALYTWANNDGSIKSISLEFKKRISSSNLINKNSYFSHYSKSPCTITCSSYSYFFWWNKYQTRI